MASLFAKQQALQVMMHLGVRVVASLPPSPPALASSSSSSKLHDVWISTFKCIALSKRMPDFRC